MQDSPVNVTFVIVITGICWLLIRFNSSRDGSGDFTIIEKTSRHFVKLQFSSTFPFAYSKNFKIRRDAVFSQNLDIITDVKLCARKHQL